jgi:hypothetical protein
LVVGAGVGATTMFPGWGMKKYIREMIDDLQRKKKRDYIPPVPPPAEGGQNIDLNQPPEPALAGDLENQILSNDPQERARQLDFQAQQNEERERS